MTGPRLTDQLQLAFAPPIVRATVFLAVFDNRIDVISPGALPTT